MLDRDDERVIHEGGPRHLATYGTVSERTDLPGVGAVEGHDEEPVGAEHANQVRGVAG